MDTTCLRIESMPEGGVRVEGPAEHEVGFRLPAAAAGGVFAARRWDGSSLHVETDRVGQRPLFIAAPARSAVVSPSLVRILADTGDATLDDDALAVLLRLGFPIDDRTPFRGVRAVPAGGLVWRAGEGASPPRPLPLVAARTMSRDDAIDGYIERFRTAIARRAPGAGPSATLLSGGRDSRHIALELARAGTLPDRAITMRRYRPMPNDDLAVARELAARIGLVHETVPLDGSFTHYERQKNVLAHMCATEHWWFVPVGETLARRAVVSYDGIAGDVLSAGLFLTEAQHRLFEEGDHEALADVILRRWCAHDLDDWGDLLGDDERRRWSRERAIALLCENFRRYEGQANPVGMFYFWSRTRRSIALSPYALCAAVPTAHAPFLDGDVYDHLASIPAEHMWSHELHTDAITRAYPEHADIGYATSGPGRWSLAIAPVQAIRSGLALLGYARRDAPDRAPLVRAWLARVLRHRRAPRIPRRTVHFLVQLDALARGSAERDLASVEHLGDGAGSAGS